MLAKLRSAKVIFNTRDYVIIINTAGEAKKKTKRFSTSPRLQSPHEWNKRCLFITKEERNEKKKTAETEAQALVIGNIDRA